MEQAERARRNAECELQAACAERSELGASVAALGGHKKRLESELAVAQAELAEAFGEVPFLFYFYYLHCNQKTLFMRKIFPPYRLSSFACLIIKTT